jgi:hypothetical protein
MHLKPTRNPLFATLRAIFQLHEGFWQQFPQSTFSQVGTDLNISMFPLILSGKRRETKKGSIETDLEPTFCHFKGDLHCTYDPDVQTTPVKSN